MPDPIHEHVIASINGWDPLEGPARWTDATFDGLATLVFAHQYAKNAPYRAFCDRRGTTPETVESYRDIPPVPTDVFKHAPLFCGGEPAHTFLTSGTTQGERGAHAFATLDVYRAALVGPFRRFCLPDRDQIRMLVAAPHPDRMPESSLSFMLGELVDRLGTAESEYFVRASGDGSDAGGLTLDVDGLAGALDQACADGEPVMVLGTAFAFVEIFDRTERDWQLADGSRVMETGGLKGRTREVSREALYAMFYDRLGLEPADCVGEYSMTELSSQAYTDDLWRAHRGRAAEAEHRGTFQTPPWVRVELVDPQTLEPLDAPAEGDSRIRGLIRWYDLANVDSVACVQTSDVGVAAPSPHGQGAGFELLGRATGAELRGCSLTIEEILHG